VGIGQLLFEHDHVCTYRVATRVDAIEHRYAFLRECPETSLDLIGTETGLEMYLTRSGGHSGPLVELFTQEGWPVIGGGNMFSCASEDIGTLDRPGHPGHFHLTRGDNVGSVYTFGSSTVGVELSFPDGVPEDWLERNERRRVTPGTVEYAAAQLRQRVSAPYRWANMSDYQRGLRGAHGPRTELTR
jgi:hypothetical protein